MYIAGTSNGDTLHGVHDEVEKYDAWGNLIDIVDRDDTIEGFAGNDFIYAFTEIDSYDTLIGGDGNDTIYGYGGKDKIYGDNGTDLLYGGNHDDTLYGGAGMDHLDGGTGKDKMYGEGGDDSYVVDSVYDVVVEYANWGNDFIICASPVFYMPDHIESLYMETGTLNSTIYTPIYLGNKAVNIWENNGQNTIYGADGNDNLGGAGGSDLLIGVYGNDRLIGGNGSDSLRGGPGSDIFDYDVVIHSPVGARDIIQDFKSSEGDKIDLSNIDANLTLAGNQAFTQGSYVSGILTGDVIGGDDIQIELSGAPALNFNLDLIL